MRHAFPPGFVLGAATSAYQVEGRPGGRQGRVHLGHVRAPSSFSQRVARRGGKPEVQPAEGETTAMAWAIDPAGLGETLMRVRDEHSGALPLVVSENGASFRDYLDPSGRCRDI